MQDFNSIEFHDSIHELKENFHFKEREFQSFTFGNKEKCRKIFKAALLETDKSIKILEFLPEYNEIIDWMTDTKGKGLFLTGDVGRGKTNIVFYVIPLIFFHYKNKIINRIHADELERNINKFNTKKMIAIDEMGVEPITNNYGAKYEVINKLFNMAESNSKTLFISTNMNAEQVLERYGERTLDRIKRLCKIIKFQGESLRK